MSQAGIAGGGGGGGGGDVRTLSGNDFVPVGPDIFHNIGVVGNGSFGTGGIFVTGNPGGNSLIISSSGSGLLWYTTTPAVTIQTVSNQGYVVNIGTAPLLTFILPISSQFADMLEFVLDGGTAFTIAQGAGQSIRLANSQTTVGPGGSITSTAQGDSIRLICSVNSTRWTALSSMGNFIVV